MDLYALPPEQFTSARDAAVRDAAAQQDKDLATTLKALRKPSVAAWVVNTLVREQAQLLDQLLGLGTELAKAQAQGKGAELRELTERRHQVVQTVTQQAADLVERDLTPQVRAEVTATLDAALADPASAQAVRTGQLVRSLSYAGFGGDVDLDGAVAPLPSAPGKRSAHPPQANAASTPGHAGRKVKAGQEIKKLEASALNGQGALDEAARHVERVDKELHAAKSRALQALQAVEASAVDVQRAREALMAAERRQNQTRSQSARVVKEVRDSERRAERAIAALRAAQDASDRSRLALDAARRA